MEVLNHSCELEQPGAKGISLVAGNSGFHGLGSLGS